MPFRQPVDSLPAEITIHPLMLSCLLHIHRSPLVEAAIAVISGEIHHPDPPFKQGGNKLTGQTIGKAQHREIRGCSNAIRIRTVHGEVITKWQKRADLAPGTTCGSLAAQVSDIKPWMGVQKAKGLQSSIAGGTHHSNPLNPHSSDGTWVDRTDVDNGESFKDTRTAVRFRCSYRGC